MSSYIKRVHQELILLLVSLALCICFATTSCSALSFHLQGGSTRCLKMLIGENTDAKGLYEVQKINDQTVSLKITDDVNHVLFSAIDIETGKIAFVADRKSMYQICFTSELAIGGAEMQSHKISMELNIGVEAMDFLEVARQESLQPLEMEIRRLEEISKSVLHDLMRMSDRESEMRNINESTNERVLYFSLFSMLCLVSLAIWQSLYLKKFFKTKKLI